ncbi:MAG: Ig-like domain-containing protein [Sideroxyarcus sp.]|nr:Ig-like domain-containing protein [Sideroxyarcus sp.]
MKARIFAVLVAIVVSSGLGGCGGGGGGTPGGTTVPPANLLQSIAVAPASVSLNTGSTQQLTATGTYADGSTANITSTVTWASADSAVASVSSTGLVAAGSTVQNGLLIKASVGAAIGKSTVSVTDPVASLISISVPLAPTIYTGRAWSPVTWANGEYSNGTGVSPYTHVSWIISACSPANAAALNSNGWIAANAAGTCTITATSGALASAARTLTIRDPSLQSIAIIPAAPSVAAGSTLQLTATGTYIDGSMKDITNLLQWSSGNTNAVTVDNASSKGRVAGVAGGSAVIQAVAVLPASEPTVAAATTTVTVPGSAPVQNVLNASPVEDNTVMYSSLVPARQTMVYGYSAMFDAPPVPAVAVGCAWYYSLVLAQMDASCSEARLKFNLAALAGKTVVSATLRLQASSVGVGIVPRQWYVRALASSWSGASVTWDNSRTSQYYVYSQSVHNPPALIGQTIEIDQTNTVRNWVAGTYQNNGFEFVLNNYLLPNMYDISLDQFEFHSSEDSGGRGPKLIVTYQ